MSFPTRFATNFATHYSINFLTKSLLTLLFSIAATTALAAPGAHGPDGQHIAGPATADAHGDDGAHIGARIEATSELFELVGRLQGEELSVLIDRYDSNEPVLNAALEVEFGEIKARAQFHADQGDYAFDDPALLAALAKPGQHALIFTVSAGTDNDLLEGILTIAEGYEAHDDHEAHGDHDHFLWGWGAALVAALFTLAALIVLLRRRRAHNNLRSNSHNNARNNSSDRKTP
jgi:hypothetical protein